MPLGCCLTVSELCSVDADEEVCSRDGDTEVRSDMEIGVDGSSRSGCGSARMVRRFGQIRFYRVAIERNQRLDS